MRNNCSTCRRVLQPHEAHRAVCRRCEIRLRAWLREIDLQRPLLDASLHIGSAPTRGQIGGTGRAHAPLPLREDVLTLIGPGAGGTVPDPHGDQTGPLPLDALLQNWAQAVAELIRLPTHMPRPGSHGPTGPDALPAPHPGGTWSTWLTAYLPQALTASWFPAFHAEVSDLIHHIRAITLSEPQRRRKEAPCPRCHAFLLFEQDWETYLDCANCELLLTPDEYRAHRDAVMPTLYRFGVLMTAATAAKETPPA
jgi:hypothetical protein